jgi:2-C-methyl-D-erythritol 4-phosphate cytidylyltransferase/2-C-methyl-D-erythritol 2,4-cyclodiphosphate synthase
MRTAAIIVAAGSGTRAGSGLVPKQYQAIGGVPVVARAIAPFLQTEAIDTVQVVVGEGHDALYYALRMTHTKLRVPCMGGATRQISVQRGLDALAPAEPTHVLIHDAARPFVSPALIERVVDALKQADAVVPTLPVANTLKRTRDGFVTETVPRDNLEAAETPQGFAYAAIVAAHAAAARTSATFTDDAAIAEHAGMRVMTVAGDPANIKLTTAADIGAADRRLAREEALRLGDVRTGFGYDVHPFGPGNQVMLGGIAIPHTHRLVGHSDADVILHALTDAVLGALGDGDIGQHFPPSDERWRGAASRVFLAEAAARVRARGGVIANLDVSYVGEGPRLSQYRDAMRASIAAIAGIAVERVGVKATTNEKLGFIGRGEGAAAQAVATIRLPFLPGASLS